MTTPPARLLALLAALAAAPTAAQTGQASVGVTYQQVVEDPALADSASLDQVAVPVSVFAAVAPGVDVSLRAAYASTSRGGAAGVDGFTDARVGVSARRAVGGGEVAVAVTAAVPAGGGLTRDEAATAFRAAQDFYGFAAPTLRGGPSLAPSVSAAFPVGAALVVGGGVAYRLRPAFEPVAGVDDAFDPGEEVTVTAGLDALLPDGSTLAVDGLYARYGSDTLHVRRGADTVASFGYATGDVVGLSATWAGLVGSMPVSVYGAGRIKGDSDVAPTAEVRLGRNTAVPAQAQVVTTARVRLGPALTADVSVGGRYYSASEAAEDAEAFGSRSLVDLRVLPTYRLGGGAALVGRLGGTVGSFTAVEVGLGLSVVL